MRSPNLKNCSVSSLCVRWRRGWSRACVYSAARMSSRSLCLCLCLCLLCMVLVREEYGYCPFSMDTPSLFWSNESCTCKTQINEYISFFYCYFFFCFFFAVWPHNTTR